MRCSWAAWAAARVKGAGWLGGLGCLAPLAEGAAEGETEKPLD